MVLVPAGPSGHVRCFKHLYTFQAMGAHFCLLPPTATYLLSHEHYDRPSPPTMAMHQLTRLSHQSFKLHGSLEVGMSKWHQRWQGGEWLCMLPPLVSIGRDENACAHSPSCQCWCNVEHRSWPILEGHLGHRDPGWLYLPAVPPQLHL